jgi:hypothetical protein
MHWNWFETAAVDARSGKVVAVPWGTSAASDEAWFVKTA